MKEALKPAPSLRREDVAPVAEFLKELALGIVYSNCEPGSRYGETAKETIEEAKTRFLNEFPVSV